MKNVSAQRRNITEPADWWKAFLIQMKRDGETNLSRWIGERLVAGLDDDLRKRIGERRTPGQPAKS